MIKTKIDAQNNHEIALFNMPLPPSINQSMAIYNGRMLSSASKRSFFKDMRIYSLKNKKSLTRAVEPLYEAMAQDKTLCLRVDCYFALPHQKLFTQKNEVKVFDANNRLKSALDGLSQILEIDDKYFASGVAEKITTTRLNPFFIAHIKLMKIRSDLEINALLA